MSNIFGVSPLAQEKLVTSLCFGKCGKIAVAGLDGGPGVGPLFPCTQEQCPYEEKRSEAIGEVNGDTVFLRKLTEVLK